jgi:type VI secretion system protein ImpF
MKGFEPNLLEKLFDGESRVTGLPVVLRRLSVEELKDSVAGDVESLLNTRVNYSESSLRGFEQCQRSIATYGLNDFVGRSLFSFEDRVFICRSIENAISRHESRLKQVRVNLVPDSQGIKMLCFSISAMLVVKPTHEPVNFDALLHAGSLKYSVARARKTVLA